MEERLPINSGNFAELSPGDKIHGSLHRFYNSIVVFQGKCPVNFSAIMSYTHRVISEAFKLLLNLSLGLLVMMMEKTTAHPGCLTAWSLHPASIPSGQARPSLALGSILLYFWVLEYMQACLKRLCC